MPRRLAGHSEGSVSVCCPPAPWREGGMCIVPPGGLVGRLWGAQTPPAPRCTAPSPQPPPPQGPGARRPHTAPCGQVPDPKPVAPAEPALGRHGRQGRGAGSRDAGLLGSDGVPGGRQAGPAQAAGGRALCFRPPWTQAESHGENEGTEGHRAGLPLSPRELGRPGPGAPPRPWGGGGQ